MKRVQALIRAEKLEVVQHRLAELGFLGFMVLDVRSHGATGETVSQGEWRGVPYGMAVKHKLLVDVLVDDDEVAAVTDAIQDTASTGQAGDGVIYVIDLAAVIPISPANV